MNHPRARTCDSCAAGLTLRSRLTGRFGKEWNLLAGSGCLLLFVFPPLGLILLLLAALTRGLKQKPAMGACPHCGERTAAFLVRDGSREFPCFHCGKLVLWQGTEEEPVFVKAPHPFPSGMTEAVDTAWTPLGGSASFRTHRLVLTEPGRMEFKATTGSVLFDLVFVASGLAVMALVVAREGFSWEGRVVGPLLAGFVFFLGGGLLLVHSTTPLVFDKMRGLFRKGRRQPGTSSGRPPGGSQARLEDVRALQLLGKTEPGRRGPGRPRLELNLVLRDGSRIHLVSHAATGALRDEARTLAGFLEKPLWDRSDLRGPTAGGAGFQGTREEGSPDRRRGEGVVPE
jgi:hypothetical protein